MIRYTLTKNNLHIEDSYQVPKKDFAKDIDIVREGLSWIESEVRKRSMFSLTTEWACHNFLYRLGICRSRTKDVDLNHPQKIWEKVVYPIFGSIAYIFIK